MNKIHAVFLDRDGVINKKKDDYVKSWEEFEFLDDVDKALKLFSEHGIKIIIVTNQSIINRKIIPEEKLKLIHQRMENILKVKGITIDGIFYCPHKPDEYCDCRKPKPGLIKKALECFDLLPENCVLIGDSKTDVEAGNAIGVTSYLLKNQSLFDISKILTNTK
ncbi:MAG: D-glycero-alpha-D-manno-heptose-1,7-bisphosphate 7-phosphatase [Candidatus Nitrosopumilus sp. bin_7KS]